MRADTTAAIILVSLSIALPLQAEKLRITAKDAGTGQPAAARAYLRLGGKSVIPAGSSAYRRASEEHFLLTGDDTFELEPGPYDLEVVRGLEYEPAKVSCTVAAGSAATVEIVLKRWAWMNRDGWYSADMHVHRDPRELARILLAEDLNFAPAITYHVWSTRVSQPFPMDPAFPVQVDATHFYTANSQEIERIQGGPGAVILLGKNLPIPFEGGEYYPPAARFTRPVHEEGGYVGGDKLFWLDNFANIALGEIDFIELNCNHFLPRDVHADPMRWSHWPVEAGYPGDQGFALWMMDSYYRVLNCGFALPLSGGTASGVMAAPVGYNRVYAFLGDQPLTYDNLMRAIKTGRSFTTNGPLLDLRINGRVGPGAHLEIRANEEVRIEGVVRSRKGLAQVDLIVNGRVHRSQAAQGEKEFRVSEVLKPAASCWVALRAFEPAEGTVVFGHTSPAYLIVDRQPLRSPVDAKYLLQKIDELIKYTRERGVFEKPEHLEETLALYREARAVYERRAEPGR